MSTTFGIPQRQIDLDKIVDKDGDLLEYIDTSFFEPVFFRGNNSRWLNPIAELLPDDIMVFATDNSQQGIYTIGDIKKFLNSKNKDS